MSKYPPGTRVKDYCIAKQLGQGSFGVVYEAYHSKNQEIVAIKCIPKSLEQSQPKAFQLFQQEVACLKKINNPNVVKFIDYLENKETCFLVQELCNEGEVEKYVQKFPKKRVPYDQAIQFLKQLLNGFKALHQFNIIHRDLKLANLLMHNSTVKIADFGFAKELYQKTSLTRTVLGTPYTMAPEVLEEKPYGLDADLYSLGVNFYELLYGTFPFNGRNEFELLNNIKAQKIQFDVPDVKITGEAVDLLRQMLQYDRNKRITWQQIYQHKLFKGDDKGNMNYAIKDIDMNFLQQSKIRINMADNEKFYKDQQRYIEQYQKIQEQQQKQLQRLASNQQQQQMQQQQQQQIQPENQIQQQQQQFLAQNQQQQNMPINANQNNQMEIENDVNEHRAQALQDNFVAYQDQQYLNMLQENHKKKLQQDEIVHKLMEIYLNEVNIYKQIIKCIYNIHSLPPTSINLIYPGFFLLKKLRVFNNNFIQNMQNNKNIFQLQYFDILVNSEPYKLLIQQLNMDQETVELYYQQRKEDTKDLMKQTPNPDIIAELDDNQGPAFNQLFSQIMINYYLSLAEEVEQYDKQRNEAHAIQFEKHIIEVIDCLDLERMFRVDKIFNFQHYQTFKDSLDRKKRKQLIQQKIDFYFKK